MNKALVLLSGGQDSTTCLFWAKTMFDYVYTLVFEYGQRHREEINAARDISAHAGTVAHFVVPLNSLEAIGGSALVNNAGELTPDGGYEDDQAPNGLPSSFVPGRNLMFLTLAGAVAAREGIKNIVTGVCETDYSGYPDCRHEFIMSAEQTINLAMPSSARIIRIHTPLMWTNKADTVRMATRLPGCWSVLGASVTCYKGHRPGCGVCPACKLRSQGFKEAGYEDPARYRNSGPDPVRLSSNGQDAT